MIVREMNFSLENDLEGKVVEMNVGQFEIAFKMAVTVI